MFRLTKLTLVCSLGIACASLPQGACAQERYFPLDHRAPTGVAGRWSALTKPGVYGAFQPVRVAVPTRGTVTFYAGSPDNVMAVPAPAQAGMMPGRVYRFRISDMPEFPGVELYPTVEILDRLHPPAGQAEEFPIPVEITEEEIEIVLQDRMITKVVYLEQPNLAPAIEQTQGIRVESLPPTVNLLQAADLRGRPMAILRLGGRIPDPQSPSDEFFSTSPIVISAQPAARPAAAAPVTTVH
jgi:hypothetical protein